MTQSDSFPNRLITESSPYLRQHALNPVDWYAWGPEALAKAKAGRTCVDVALKCVELAGSIGYTETALLEKWSRDAKILDIFEGTQQIQLLVVASPCVTIRCARAAAIIDAYRNFDTPVSGYAIDALLSRQMIADRLVVSRNCLV